MQMYLLSLFRALCVYAFLRNLKHCDDFSLIGRMTDSVASIIIACHFLPYNCDDKEIIWFTEFTVKRKKLIPKRRTP